MILKLVVIALSLPEARGAAHDWCVWRMLGLECGYTVDKSMFEVGGMWRTEDITNFYLEKPNVSITGKEVVIEKRQWKEIRIVEIHDHATVQVMELELKFPSRSKIVRTETCLGILDFERDTIKFVEFDTSYDGSPDYHEELFHVFRDGSIKGGWTGFSRSYINGRNGIDRLTSNYGYYVYSHSRAN